MEGRAPRDHEKRRLPRLPLPAHGCRVDPERRPVLLVHGIWKSGASFHRMARALTARGLDAHTLDLKPNDGSAPLEDLAAQIAAFAADRFPGPFDLVGFSMGGVVSRYYLQRLGGAERVRRFVTIPSPHHGTMTALLSN